MHQSILKIEVSEKISIELIYIEGGSFLMGDDQSKYDDEKPAHEVHVNDFYMGKYQVTQGLWEAVTENNPSNFKGENRPVEQVSWNEVQEFIKKLNEQTGEALRLPTEAEWEYAARGGKYSEGYAYAGSDKLKQVGWYTENSNDETHDVGLLLANELSLYDMSGNVWEWCQDDWHDNYKGAPKDGSAWIDRPNRGAYRVLRGGSPFYGPSNCRSVNRGRSWPDDNRDYDIGFRLVSPFRESRSTL